MHRSWTRRDRLKLASLWMRRHEHAHRVRRLVSKARDGLVDGCERIALADRGAHVEPAGSDEADHALDVVTGIGERPPRLEFLGDEAFRQRPGERLDADADEDRHTAPAKAVERRLLGARLADALDRDGDTALARGAYLAADVRVAGVEGVGRSMSKRAR